MVVSIGTEKRKTNEKNSLLFLVSRNNTQKERGMFIVFILRTQLQEAIGGRQKRRKTETSPK